VSGRVHSRYPRTLADAPNAGERVELRLRVRRFFCDNPVCSKGTFAEQVPELTERYARRIGLLRGMLEAIGLALAGRAGARLAARLGMTAGRDSLLRFMRALPKPAVGVVPVLGVDDFALCRGRVYGTVLIDMATHRPVDVLADREASTFADWLKAHPGVEVICRDRAGAYPEGARVGAPGAVQVADRWHLWHNLAEHLENTVRAHRRCLRASTAPSPEDTAAGADADEEPAEPLVLPEGELAILVRTRERYRAISELAAGGASTSAIAQRLRLDRRTARRFVRAQDLDELTVKTRQRASLLDGFTDYLHHRWTQGACDAAALAAELRELGFTGSEQTVRRYLHPLRDGRPAPTGPTAGAHSPGGHQLAAAPTREARVRRPGEAQGVLATCPKLAAAAGHVHHFAEMLTGRHGDRLNAWITAVEGDGGVPELARFTAGLCRDRDAVVAGLSCEHSSGAVEGAVNRIKMLKRQMFGRAGFELLRTRILLA